MHSGDTEKSQLKKKKRCNNRKVQAKNIQLHVIFFKSQKKKEIEHIVKEKPM